jgi:hypothetical protein
VLTLYSYPELFGVADNNGYGLKVFAFLRLAGVAFRHEHIFDASSAPRGQLPYIVDDGETIGDSDTIIAHLIAKYRAHSHSTLCLHRSSPRKRNPGRLPRNGVPRRLRRGVPLAGRSREESVGLTMRLRVMEAWLTHPSSGNRRACALPGRLTATQHQWHWEPDDM